MLAIYLGSDQNDLPGPEGIPHFDKVAHFAAFGLLATLWARALAAGGSTLVRAALLALAVTSGYGALDEYHQSFTPGRDVEFADWLADSSGAAMAVVLYAAWPAYRQVLEQPLRRFTRRRPAVIPAGLAVESDQHP